MAQVPRQLTPHLDARHFFGAELRHWRELRGLSQAELGRAVHVSGDEIGKVEKAVRWPPAGLAEHCDDLLVTGGVLTRLWPLVEHERSPSRPSAGLGTRSSDLGGRTPPSLDLRDGAATPLPDGPVPARRPGAEPSDAGDPGGAGSTLPTALDAVLPGVRLARTVPDLGSDWLVCLPGGRALQPTSLLVQEHPATIGGRGRVRVDVGALGRLDDFLATPARRLLLGVEPPTRGGDPTRLFALDGRQVRRQLRRRHAARPTLAVPAAYELDDLTAGALWALAAMDDGLLADDHVLATTQLELGVYEGLTRSAVSREAAPDLSPLGRMWLGSDYCARQILGALPSLLDPAVGGPSPAAGVVDRPLFWTKEQTGEESAAWLLFRHKVEYLRRSVALASGAAGSRGGPPIRVFCLPNPAISGSHRSHRLLVLLAAALMEGSGIEVRFSTDAEHSAVPGFVLAPSGRALVATWVRTDGIWRVDVDPTPDVVTELADVAAQVAGPRAISAGERMRRLSAHLDVDWTWFHRRCTDLSEHGWGGLAQPRSRLLTLAGLTQACRYVATLHGAAPGTSA